MKTDKLLHLLQQKKFMRSGGALPLPKAQVGIPTTPTYEPNPTISDEAKKHFSNPETDGQMWYSGIPSDTKLYRHTAGTHDKHSWIDNVPFEYRYLNYGQDEELKYEDCPECFDKLKKGDYFRKAKYAIPQGGQDPMPIFDLMMPSGNRMKREDFINNYGEAAWLKATRQKHQDGGEPDYYFNGSKTPNILQEGVPVVKGTGSNKYINYIDPELGEIDEAVTEESSLIDDVKTQFLNNLHDKFTNNAFNINELKKPSGDPARSRMFEYLYENPNLPSISERINKLLLTGQKYQIGGLIKAQTGIPTDQYTRDYPPIYVTDPNDPRINYYAEAGNQYLYKRPAQSNIPLMKKRGIPNINIDKTPIKTKETKGRSNDWYMDTRGEWTNVPLQQYIHGKNKFQVGGQDYTSDSAYDLYKQTPPVVEYNPRDTPEFQQLAKQYDIVQGQINKFVPVDNYVKKLKEVTAKAVKDKVSVEKTDFVDKDIRDDPKSNFCISGSCYLADQAGDKSFKYYSNDLAQKAAEKKQGRYLEQDEKWITPGDIMQFKRGNSEKGGPYHAYTVLELGKPNTNGSRSIQVAGSSGSGPIKYEQYFLGKDNKVYKDAALSERLYTQLLKRISSNISDSGNLVKQRDALKVQMDEIDSTYLNPERQGRNVNNRTTEFFFDKNAWKGGNPEKFNYDEPDRETTYTEGKNPGEQINPKDAKLFDMMGKYSDNGYKTKFMEDHNISGPEYDAIVKNMFGIYGAETKFGTDNWAGGKFPEPRWLTDTFGVGDSVGPFQLGRKNFSKKLKDKYTRKELHDPMIASEATMEFLAENIPLLRKRALDTPDQKTYTQNITQDNYLEYIPYLHNAQSWLRGDEATLNDKKKKDVVKGDHAYKKLVDFYASKFQAIPSSIVGDGPVIEDFRYDSEWVAPTTVDKKQSGGVPKNNPFLNNTFLATGAIEPSASPLDLIGVGSLVGLGRAGLRMIPKMGKSFAEESDRGWFQMAANVSEHDLVRQFRELVSKINEPSKQRGGLAKAQTGKVYDALLKYKESLDENKIEFFDPSGLTSWDDAVKGYDSWQKSSRTSPTFNEGMDMFSAVPILGKARKVDATLQKLASTPKWALDWWKAYQAADYINDEYNDKVKKANGGLIRAQDGIPSVAVANQQTIQNAGNPYLNRAMVQAVLAKANQPVTNTLGRVISTPASKEKERREKVVANDPSKYSVMPGFQSDYNLGIQEPGADNSVFSDPIALAAALTAGRVGLGAIALSQVPRMFLSNLASEATYGLTDVGKGLLKKLSKRRPGSTLSEPIFSPEFYESKRKLDEVRQRYIDAINQKSQPKSLDDITKDVDALNKTIVPRSQATTEDLQSLLERLQNINKDLEKHIPNASPHIDPTRGGYSDIPNFNNQLRDLRGMLQFGRQPLEKPLFRRDIAKSIQDNLAEDVLFRDKFIQEQILKDDLSKTIDYGGKPVTWSPRASEYKIKMKDFKPFGGLEAWRQGLYPNKQGGSIMNAYQKGGVTYKVKIKKSK